VGERKSLKVWQSAIEIANELCDVPDELEQEKLDYLCRQLTSFQASLK
jgi:hypothetical protein